ncbi:MAG: NnrS family protein, partial [Deltaproteobacteria bacterium]|nr:NnrS family protein [Deltaproteobacteria bacterium]
IQHFKKEPYRLLFGIGCLYSILSLGIWVFSLYQGAHLKTSLAWSFSPTLIHFHLMLFGVFGFYIFGFLLTAFPRFVSQELPRFSQVFGYSIALLGSQILFWIAFLKQPSLLPFAGITEILTYLVLWIHLFNLYRREGNILQNKQPGFILIALFFGILSNSLFYFSILSHSFASLQSFSIEFATYGYLMFLVISITYRVVPFFTGRIVANHQPKRGKQTLLWVFLILLGKFIFSSISGNTSIGTQSLLMYGLIFILAKEWKGWLPPSIKQAPILMVLYLGLSWMLLSLLLSAIALMGSLFPQSSFPFAFLKIPAMHALYVGCFGTLVIGISTRVVRGHGGFPIKADGFALASLLMIQTGALIRVFFPIVGIYSSGFITKAYWGGFFWIIAFIIWGIRYIPFLFAAPQSKTDLDAQMSALVKQTQNS